MTIVIAGKTTEGILFYYDRACFPALTRARSRMSYIDKVIPLSEEVVVGLAFNGATFDTEISRLQRFLGRTRDPLTTIEKYVEEELWENAGFGMTTSSQLDAGFHVKPKSVAYIVGIRQRDAFHLLIGDNQTVQRTDCGGIGSGMYQSVEQRLRIGYRRRKSISALVHHFEEVMDVAKRISHTRKELPILGLGIGLLTREGYTTLYTHPKP